jgi:hypothetical protein
VKKAAYILFSSACVAILASGFVFTKQPGGDKCELLVAVHDQQAATTKLQHLMGFHFASGNFNGGEKIVSVKTQKADDKNPNASYIRFDLGYNYVYKNQYVITGIGNIIDAKNKKVLLDQKDQFVKASGDSVIYYINDIFRGKFYKIYNLQTQSYSQVNNLLYKALPGKDVEVDYSSRLFKIWLYPPNAPKILLVKDAGYGEDMSARKDKDVKVPVYWLDDNNFIYPNYSQQQNFCTIYRVNVDKSMEAIGTISDIPSISNNSYFYKNGNGDLVYSCGKGTYVVDVKKKKVSQEPFEQLGNGFSVSTDEDPAKGRIIRYKDYEIGKYFCDIKNIKAYGSMIALNYDMMVNGERYPQGVTYWSAGTQKWKELPIDGDVASVVGFIEE